MIDAKLKSWVESANQPGSHFPIQNLPYGVFSDAGNHNPRVGVAIGDSILDLALLEEAGLLAHGASAPVFDKPHLNAFIALGRDTWRATRARVAELLSKDHSRLRDDAPLRERVLVKQQDAVLHLPVHIPGHTDFYSSKEHATNIR